ncbi:MAG: DUF4340 domain-containing protein, partial [Alphaproteobacteria bacterium]|nr:DUF4340 domain-containing protein [Alphaproteobacteria bacterium]
VALGLRADRAEASFTPRPLFPALADPSGAALERIGAVEVESPAGTIAARLVDGAWVLPDRSNYPADPAPLIAAVNAVASLTLVEPKTANPERFDLLELDAPGAGGQATLVLLVDRDGAEMAAVLFGKRGLQRSVGGQEAVYVRAPEAEQTYLAYAGTLPVADPAAWLATGFFDIARADVSRVTLTDAGGASYTIIPSPEPGGAPYTLEGLGPDEAVTSPYQLNGIVGALADLPVETVARADAIAFDAPRRAVFETATGLELRLELAPLPPQAEDGAEAGEPPAAWLRVSAATLPEADEGAAALAERINQRAEGWAFRIPGYRAEPLTRPRADVVEPAAPPEPAEPAPDAPADEPPSP